MLAGFVDSIVGGGGLILMPALFAAFPTAPPATLLGTNKGASVWGTAMATLQYSRKVSMPWHALLPATVCALVASFAGAWLVTLVSPEYLRKALPFVLTLVLAYTLAKKELGRNHAPRFSGRLEMVVVCLIGMGIGFYDGFFGPGTGSFLLFLFVRFFGFDFLGASAVAKIVNVACNFAALIWFGYAGHVLWQLGLLMAICNICGAMIGTRVALKEGSVFIRKAFLVVVGALILKTARDAFWS